MAMFLKSRCDSLLERLAAIRRASEQNVFDPPNGLLDERIGHKPINELLEMLEKNMGNIERYIRTEQPWALTSHAAEKETERFLPNPISLDSGESEESFADYRKRTMSGLDSMARHNNVAQPLQSRIHTLRNPDHWQRAQQWLVFWTAMAASAGVRRAGTANDGEDVHTQRWVEKWIAQTSSWSKSVKDRLGCDPAFVYSSMLDTKGESESGADVMLAFCFYTGSTCVIRLAYIQFKRTPPENRVSSVKIIHAEKFDQYKRIARWHEPTRGVTALYGMFSPKLSVLETISAMDVVTVRDAINAKAAVGQNSWEIGDGWVTWMTNAETMPTILAKALGQTGEGGFTSLDDAVTWIDSKLSSSDGASTQPKYWIIQAMSDPEIALDKTIRNPGDEFYESVKALARKYRYKDLTLKYERNRGGLSR